MLPFPVRSIPTLARRSPTALRALPPPRATSSLASIGNGFLSPPLAKASLPTKARPLVKSPLCFHALTNSFSRKSFGIRLICVAPWCVAHFQFSNFDCRPRRAASRFAVPLCFHKLTNPLFLQLLSIQFDTKRPGVWGRLLSTFNCRLSTSARPFRLTPLFHSPPGTL
jgi:hypothetical protein